MTADIDTLKVRIQRVRVASKSSINFVCPELLGKTARSLRQDSPCIAREPKGTPLRTQVPSVTCSAKLPSITALNSCTPTPLLT